MNKQYIFCLLALFLAFSACEEQTFDPVLRLNGPAAITAPTSGASFVIAEGTQDDELATFAWSEADFGVAIGPVYTLEADLAGNNFADPKTLVPSASTTSATVTNGTVNSFLIERGIAGGTAQDIEVRVKAVAGLEEDGNVQYSAPITLTVTPFEAEIVYPQLWVPGDYQGWTPETAPGIFSVQDNGIFEGFVYFSADNTPFKMTDAPNWDNGIYGAGGDGVLATPGDNIELPGTAGMYLLRANINDLSYSVDATQWGIIGSATPTGWDSDTDMTYNAETGLLSITMDLTVNGDDNKIKFRANDDWPINLGDNDADGKLEFGGADIVVPESGNYTITLDLTGAIYTFNLEKN